MFVRRILAELHPDVVTRPARHPESSRFPGWLDAFDGVGSRSWTVRGMLSRAELYKTLYGEFRDKRTSDSISIGPMMRVDPTRGGLERHRTDAS